MFRPLTGHHQVVHLMKRLLFNFVILTNTTGMSHLRNCSSPFPPTVQSVLSSHPATYLVGTGCSFPRVKRSVRQITHSPRSNCPLTPFKFPTHPVQIAHSPLSNCPLTPFKLPTHPVQIAHSPRSNCPLTPFKAVVQNEWSCTVPLPCTFLEWCLLK